MEMFLFKIAETIKNLSKFYTPNKQKAAGMIYNQNQLKIQ